MSKYELPQTYHLGSCGCGCFLEPPGHPTYFVRSIFTKYGNNPPYGQPCYYLNGFGYTDLKAVSALYGNKTFPKLPLEHPRTRAWIEALYTHLQHCYHNKEKEFDSDDTIIFPVPSYRLKHFKDDHRFSEEWRQKEMASISQYNLEIVAKYRAIAITENHKAVIAIRKHYLDYSPELELIYKPPKRTPTWWERLDEKPTPENCPGDVSLRRKHPVNGKRCQVCGWLGEGTD